MDVSSPRRSVSLALVWAGPLAISLSFIAMALWTWGAWPDLLVDFGKELYVPWRISQGKALYADVAYFLGPLSPHFNALCFILFGVGLRTLVVSNLLIAALIAALLFRLLDGLAGRLAATVGGLVFVLLFAFPQYLEGGNYNFICPYVHEVTHGTALSLLALLALRAHLRAPPGQLRHAALAGLCIGLTFLTRAEIFVACTAGVGAGLTLDAWARRPGWRPPCACAAAALAPPIIALLLLCLRLPLSSAIEGVLMPYTAIFKWNLAGARFYRWSMGTLDLGDNLRALLRYSGVLLGLFGGITTLALALRGPRRARLLLPTALFVMLAVVLELLVEIPSWLSAPRPLPLALLGLILISAHALRKIVARAEDPAGLILRLAALIFALVMLGKIMLFSRIYHYGFAMAMPGFVLASAALVSWLPAWIDRRGGVGGLLRAAVLGCLLAACVAHLRISAYFYGLKDTMVSSGADAFRADRRGVAMNELLTRLRQAPAGATVAVFPEGAIINYLARRGSSTPYLNFIPTDLTIFEAQVLPAFRANPPDYTVLVQRNTSDYGARSFGGDYGQECMRWIQDNYRPIWRHVVPPIHDERFAIMLLRRKDAQGAILEK